MNKYIVCCVVNVEVEAGNTKAAIEQARHRLSEHDDITECGVMQVSKKMDKGNIGGDDD